MVREFAFGSVVYPVIELAYRKRTHPTMALAGGLGVCAIAAIYKSKKCRPIWRQALMGGISITMIELGIGMLFNKHYHIWDYRRSPMNVRGQICLPFTFAWCGLSYLALLGMRMSDSVRS